MPMAQKKKNCIFSGTPSGSELRWYKGMLLLLPFTGWLCVFCVPVFFNLLGIFLLMKWKNLGELASEEDVNFQERKSSNEINDIFV